jgi:hypothetical protein
MVVLDADPLPRVQSSEAPLQFFENAVVHRDQAAIGALGAFGHCAPCDPERRFARRLKIHLPLQRIGACEAAG